MNKAELTARVARDTRMTKVQAARVIDSLLEHITKTLKKGERASLVGFGTFTVTRRRARTGSRDPDPDTGPPCGAIHGREGAEVRNPLSRPARRARGRVSAAPPAA